MKTQGFPTVPFTIASFCVFKSGVCWISNVAQVLCLCEMSGGLKIPSSKA